MRFLRDPGTLGEGEEVYRAKEQAAAQGGGDGVRGWSGGGGDRPRRSSALGGDWPAKWGEGEGGSGAPVQEEPEGAGASPDGGVLRAAERPWRGVCGGFPVAAG